MSVENHSGDGSHLNDSAYAYQDFLQLLQTSKDLFFPRLNNRKRYSFGTAWAAFWDDLFLDYIILFILCRRFEKNVVERKCKMGPSRDKEM